MTAKEFLLTEKALNLSEIAALMWTTNKSAKTYLSMKLHNTGGRTWTAKDEKLATDVLTALGKRIEGVRSDG